MAEAFLQVVLDNLNSLIQNEFGLLQGYKKEMEKLSNTLSTIQAVLEDAEEKQLKDKTLKNWLRKLKDAAYELDDILDECQAEAYKKEHASYLTCFSPNVFFRHKIGIRMRDAREKLDEISEDRRKFHLHETVADRRAEVMAMRETGSFVSQTEVYGRDEDKEKIVECLVNEVAGSDDIFIYPILGMGGLGKTTLAQFVFNDDRIERHFECRIWVFVFEDFNVKRLITEIIKFLGEEVSETSALAVLQKSLKDKLNGKRYLLVLDDVWNEDQEKWDQLKSTLTCGSEGSSIVVTTRLARVASIVGTRQPHCLSAVSEDDCWLLFKQRAFGNNTEQPENILAIAREIVKKCQGVPLAAKTLGSLMRFKSNENEWFHVKDSELWNLPQEENSILPALRFSYSNLPVKLRQCFAFCALFPKNFEIQKQRLIHLWMANGFISSNGTLDAEEVGNEVFNELYWRSLIQDFDSGYTGSYKMHDLVHDLAQSVAEDECCITEAGRTSDHLSRRTHHVTFTFFNDSFTIPDAFYRVQCLRTLLVNPINEHLALSQSVECLGDFSNFPSLRALEIKDARFTKLLPSIGNLMHLRYLHLFLIGIKYLPRSLCRLWNLQILKLEWCLSLQQLPHHMRRLKNLHLYIKCCSSLISMPPKLRQMTALRTLPFFIVGRRRGYRLAELQGLNLSGRLHIKHLERVGNPMDAAEASLGEKQNLRELFLSWESDGQSEMQGNAEMVLEALEPHSNLEKLRISGYSGINMPLWMSSPVLNNVVSMQLINLNCLQLPHLGKLPSLKDLSISGMKHVKYIDNYFPGEGVKVFPSLEKLEIWKLPNLEKLSIEQGRNTFPCLNIMVISGCPKLTLPCLPSLAELSAYSCYSEVLLSSISNLYKLTSLLVVDNDEMMTLPESVFTNLTSLRTFIIQRFTKLEVLPSNPSLEKLEICELPNLEKLSIEQGRNTFPCLNSMVIEGCPKLTLPCLLSLTELSVYSCCSEVLLSSISNLNKLTSLWIVENDEVMTLPDSVFMNLTSLQSLNIWRFTKLESLPEQGMRCLKSLQSLYIKGCKKLNCLSNGLKHLTALQSLSICDVPELVEFPDGLQHLVSLEYLEINGCPELQKRCQKEIGEDWPKIAHIPFVYMPLRVVEDYS